MATVLEIEGPFEIGGDLIVEDALHNTSGVVTFTGSPTLTVKGHLTNSASWTTNNSETVILNGASGTQMLTSGGCQFYILRLDGSTATTYQTQDASIIGTLQFYQGILDFSNRAAQITTFTTVTASTLSILAGTGEVTWKGDLDFTDLTAFDHENGTFIFAQTSGTQTIDPAGYGFGSVLFSGAAIYSISSPMSCTALELSAGSLSYGSNAITVSGNAVFSGGSVVPAAGKTIMTGASATLNDSGAINIGNLQAGQ